MSGDEEQAAILLTGSELLDGRVRDRNGYYLATSLAARGMRVSHLLYAPDDMTTLVGDLSFLFAAGPAVLVVSGGLGTTHDDITAEAVARACGLALREHADARRMVEAAGAEAARRRGIDFAPLRRQALTQARLPEGSRALAPAGVAPGFALQHDETRVYVLPGVPSELEAMWPTVLDELERGALFPAVATRTARIHGVGEWQLAAVLADCRQERLTVAVTAADGELTVVLRHSAADAQAEEEATALVASLQSALPVFSTDGRTVDQLVADGLRNRGATVACAESCTGGLIGARLTSVPGSSDYFLGGVIGYADGVKKGVLGVGSDVLRTHGAVSAEVAEAMADGVRRLTGATYSVSATGVAGPGGGTEAKPVGLVFLTCSGPEGTRTVARDFPGDRESVRRRATVDAFHLLREAVAS